MNLRKITTAAALLTIVAMQASQAAIAVVSNITPSAEPVTLVDDSGTALPAGTQARLGTFPGADPAQIASAAASGSAALLHIFTPFGNPFAIGDGGANSTPGAIEASTTEPAPPTTTTPEALYLIIGNTPTLETATQLLVLKFPTATLPQDFPGGIETYVTLHLRDAITCYGTSDSNGIHTAPMTSPYEVWIATHLPTSPPADRLPTADPDLDERTNLYEYAQGSAPTLNAPATPGFTIEIEDNIAYAIYSRRLFDPTITYQPECNTALQTTWIPITTTPEVIPSPTTPPGYERVRQQLPSNNPNFTRLKINHTP